MVTYKEILGDVKKHNKISIKTCWIAHVKELNGIDMRPAPNRISLTSCVHPCPENIRPLIEASMRRLCMLSWICFLWTFFVLHSVGMVMHNQLSDKPTMFPCCKLFRMKEHRNLICLLDRANKYDKISISKNEFIIFEARISSVAVFSIYITTKNISFY